MMEVERICADELGTLLKKQDLLLIDTRDRASFEKGRIGNAIHATTSYIEHLVMTTPKRTPILLYCYRGSASLVHGRMFADFGFREVYSLNGGYEGWMLAMGEDSVQTWLKNQGFGSITSTLPGGITPLMQAARLGDRSMAADLILAGAEIDTRNADGNQALWFSCFSENLEIMDLLIAAGCNVDNVNDNGSTCLMYAASSGKAGVAGKLLEAGADRTLANYDDYTALDMAASRECLELLMGRKLLARIDQSGNA